MALLGNFTQPNVSNSERASNHIKKTCLLKIMIEGVCFFAHKHIKENDIIISLKLEFETNIFFANR